jgi:uncharacterized protein
LLSLFTTSHASFIDAKGRLQAGPRRVRAHPRRNRRSLRTLQLLTGLIAVGVGVGLVISAELGVASWDVLHVGLAELTGWSVGMASIAVGLGAAALATLLGERPRLGSLVPLTVVGPAIDASLMLAPSASTLTGQLALLVTGMGFMAFGVGAYVASDHGAGPSDLVFLAIARRGVPIAYARLLVDGSAVLVGWAIGGPVGLGTVIVTLLLGPLVGLAIKGFDLVPARRVIETREAAFDHEQGRELAWEIS